MHRILVAVDGSQRSERAVSYLIGLIKDGGLLGGRTEIHLLNVVPELPLRISTSMNSEELDRYYQDRSAPDCRAAMLLLDKEGVTYVRHTRIGNAAYNIVACARETHCDSILMGTHGAGRVSDILLGSVTTKVIQLTEIPVSLVK